eukprot:CAMPEP_0180113160 /NCGR_PEP_ID=MMETSP0985-20121206/36613_1 /TAXON_ID=483367 /ORGANISM="non described non described, Strain CCMP 2436" /LENGTH=83 /DNA_ID=CAMNT_0022051603 /DNA_START=702 /DNA_END=949 /DNA_ORIENTATION=+
MTLTNIKTGKDMGREAAGLLITGDLILQTQTGDTQIIELTNFYAPHKKSRKERFLPILDTHLTAGDRMAPGRVPSVLQAETVT